MATSHVYEQKIEQDLKQLSSNQIAEVSHFVEWLRDREERRTTEEIVANPELLADICEALKDSKAGKGKPWRKVRRDV